VTLEVLLAPCLRRPVEKLDVEVRAVLECGLYQMLCMNVPPRAAVDEAVKLVRGLKKSSAAGLVNAVLRKAQHADVNAMKFGSERERVRAVWSVSEAVADAVMKAMPNDYDAYFAASFAKREVCLRVNTLKTSTEELAAALGQKDIAVREGQLPNCLYAELPGGVAEEENFLAGRYHVQGEASQFACAALMVKKGQDVLDVCAAPGGKTATLAQHMGGGEGLVACDVRENRLPLIENTLKRLGIKGVRVLHRDAAGFDPAQGGCDRLLCDVPCSGLGVLAAKPDLRVADGKNFEELPRLQWKILTASARYIKQGGMLVYSTCTVRSEENAEVVRRFLAENAGFRLAMPPRVPKGAQMDDKLMTILPQHTGMDGFFVATLERL
jgi:16S rRNA (cytosine967-C5)-methyltransferase